MSTERNKCSNSVDGSCVFSEEEKNDFKIKLAALLQHDRENSITIGVDDAVIERVGRTYSILKDATRDTGANIDITKIYDGGKDAIVRIESDAVIFSNPQKVAIAIDVADVVDIFMTQGGNIRMDFTFRNAYITTLAEE